MATNRLMYLSLLAALTACNNNTSTTPVVPTSSSTSPSGTPSSGTTSEPAKPVVNESDAFPEGQYQVMFAKVSHPPGAPTEPGAKLKLTPEEQASYRKAAAAAGGVSHVHVDATGNQLEFSADKAAEPAAESHVNGNEATIAVPKGVPAKKIVVSPEALKLMQKRAAP